MTDIAQMVQRVRRLASVPTPASALRPGAEVLLAEMQSRVPRDTGTLHDSLEIRRRRDDLEVGPGPEGFYGAFLEFGTSKMAARPWFRPAVDSARRRAVRAIEREAMRQVVAEMRRGL